LRDQEQGGIIRWGVVVQQQWQHEVKSYLVLTGPLAVPCMYMWLLLPVLPQEPAAAPGLVGAVRIVTTVLDPLSASNAVLHN